MPQKRREDEEEIVGRPVPRRYAQDPKKVRHGSSDDDREDVPSRRPVAQRHVVHNRLRKALREDDEGWEEL